jgi:hypothetical protein
MPCRPRRRTKRGPDRRDIIELQDAGIDIEVSKRANRIFAVLTAERSHSPVSITKRERFTLLAVRRVFDVFKRTRSSKM